MINRSNEIVPNNDKFLPPWEDWLLRQNNEASEETMHDYSTFPTLALDAAILWATKALCLSAFSNFLSTACFDCEIIRSLCNN